MDRAVAYAIARFASQPSWVFCATLYRIGSSNYDADVMGALAPYQLLTWQRSDS